MFQPLPSGPTAEQHLAPVIFMPDIVDPPEEKKIGEREAATSWENRKPFVIPADTARMATVITDASERHDPIIFANAGFLALTGYGREEVLGKSLGFLMAQGTEAQVLAQIDGELGENSDSGCETCCRRKDGSEFWAAIFISPIRNETGDVVRHFASFIDLTKHKEAEARSRMIIGELNHRVKNSISTVRSIVWQAFRAGSDPEAIRESIESRLLALSRSHDLLVRENWESAGLLDVITDALEPFVVADGRPERLVIWGRNFRFPPKASLALGIAFNELATNAVKYGAFSNRSGSIRIAWDTGQTSQGDRLLLHWQEKDGPPVTPPSRKGFGSWVLERGLAHELEGRARLDYRSNGVVYTMDIPAPLGACNE